MSLKVLELNDVSLQVGDAGGILAASPGFALLEGKELKLGEAAEQQHRIFPTSSFDKFWHELNMEPLHTRGRIRHHADLAYSQLLELATQAEIDDEVLFAVPGHYSNQQLGLLLGVASQCPFQVTGMVDSALAAAADGTERRIVYAGLHLHQVLLTRLHRKDGELTVENVVQVPQIGRQQLLEELMRMANDAFIRQCRFNPHHQASSEQGLYSALAEWIGGGNEPDNLVMELKAGAITHTAKLPCDHVLAGLQKCYDKLLRSMRPLTEASGTAILLDHRLARLPGAAAALGEAGPMRVARPEAVTAACLRYRELIAGGDSVHRILALPCAESSQAEQTREHAAVGTPTHVLFRHRAMPVSDLAVINSANGSGGNGLVLNIPGPRRQLGRIHLRQSQVLLDCGEIEFRLNDVPVKGLQTLKLGDRIRFPENTDELLMIEVSDGR